MSYITKFEDDLIQYDYFCQKLTELIDLGLPLVYNRAEQRKVWKIFNKWQSRFHQRDQFLDLQKNFPEHIAFEVAYLIAPPGRFEHYFPFDPSTLH